MVYSQDWELLHNQIPIRDTILHQEKVCLIITPHLDQIQAMEADLEMEVVVLAVDPPIQVQDLRDRRAVLEDNI